MFDMETAKKAIIAEVMFIDVFWSFSLRLIISIKSNLFSPDVSTHKNYSSALISAIFVS